MSGTLLAWRGVSLTAAILGALPASSFHASPRLFSGLVSRDAAAGTRSIGWSPMPNPVLTGASALFLSTGVAEPKIQVLVPIGDGTEEIEGVTVVDTLVRAGASVTVASVGGTLQVTCSRGVKLVADCMVEECKGRSWDAVVCPGGMPGATNLKESTDLEVILKGQVWSCLRYYRRCSISDAGLAVF
ncbi:unnamed protein product [Discosporangium mesarthrocarpum]